jgi:hypothetical protein
MPDHSITKDQAIQKARDFARPACADIDKRVVHLEETSTEWHVDFVNPQALADGRPQHISVWVDKNTEHARLFQGR